MVAVSAHRAERSLDTRRPDAIRERHRQLSGIDELQTLLIDQVTQHGAALVRTATLSRIAAIADVICTDLDRQLAALEQSPTEPAGRTERQIITEGEALGKLISGATTDAKQRLAIATQEAEEQLTELIGSLRHQLTERAKMGATIDLLSAEAATATLKIVRQCLGHIDDTIVLWYDTRHSRVSQKAKTSSLRSQSPTTGWEPRSNSPPACNSRSAPCPARRNSTPRSAPRRAPQCWDLSPASEAAHSSPARSQWSSAW